jgi:hypothetical protein
VAPKISAIRTVLAPKCNRSAWTGLVFLSSKFLIVNAVGFLLQLTKQLCLAMQGSRLSVTSFILLLPYLGVEGAVFRANELRLKEDPPSFVAGGAGLTGAAGFTALFSLF